MSRSKHIDKTQVEHAAKLARIKLNPEELQVFTEQFQQILDYFTAIDEVRTDDIEPAGHSAVRPDVLREDTARDCLPQDQALQNVSSVKDGYVKSSRIM